MHEPSPEEFLAPFYPDPAQRIVILDMQGTGLHLAVSVGALLELKSHGGAEIGWDEWRGRVLRLVLHGETTDFWVSGCRLFYIFSTEVNLKDQMQVYDFSVRGRAQYLSEGDPPFGGFRYLSPTTPVLLPCAWLVGPCGGRDSMVFPSVSSAILFFLGDMTKWGLALCCSVVRFEK